MVGHVRCLVMEGLFPVALRFLHHYDVEGICGCKRGCRFLDSKRAKTVGKEIALTRLADARVARRWPKPHLWG